VSRTARGLAALVLFGLALAGCGKKGPPVAPELRLPAPPDALSAIVDERSILVTWSDPVTRLDGSQLRDLALVRLFRREDQDGGPLKPAMLSAGKIVGYDDVAAISLASPAPATVEGRQVRWVDERGLVLGHRYVYVTTAVDSLGRSSPPSERRAITFLAAPAPPRDVRTRPGNRQVTVEWQAPAEFTDGSPVSGEVRYIVLRGAGAAGPLTVLAAEPRAGLSYLDEGLENDTEYRYAVRGVRVDPRGTARGAPSVIVSATPRETRPPSPPTNLVAVPSSGAVRLAWTASPAPSVALYAVYRAAGEEGFTRIGTTAGTTTFVDHDARPGVSYRYAVTAIDSAKSPNESARSNEVRVTLP
jgi:predicted small lipoprotein YifL